MYNEGTTKFHKPSIYVFSMHVIAHQYKLRKEKPETTVDTKDL